MASAESMQSAPAGFQPSESIVAPLLLAYRGVRSADALLPIVTTAAAAMPKVTNMRKHMVGRKAVAAPHTRDVFWWHVPESESYGLIARCIDVGPDQTPSQAVGSWIWEASFISFKKGQYPGLIPSDCEQVRLDVTRYQIQKNGIVGARQLALFRHLFVESFRALDPGAQIYGGQHAWRAQWWPNPLAPAATQ